MFVSSNIEEKASKRSDKILFVIVRECRAEGCSDSTPSQTEAYSVVTFELMQINRRTLAWYNSLNPLGDLTVRLGGIPFLVCDLEPNLNRHNAALRLVEEYLD